jgi:TonB family protein
VVTGVTLSSTVEGNSGMSVRVGNTTFGDPNKEKFVDPKDVKPYQGGSPEFKAARQSTLTREARVLKDFKGAYPKELAEQGVEGAVIALVEVSKSGEIRDVRLAKTCGNATLDKLALEYIKRFRFQAAEVNGEAVDSVLRYTYKFELYD